MFALVTKLENVAYARAIHTEVTAVCQTETAKVFTTRFGSEMLIVPQSFKNTHVIVLVTRILEP